MEGVISIKLLGYSALVSGQEIVQMKITGVKISSHVERIKPWLSNKESEGQLIFHHGRC